jgi:hypothetical protein
MWLGHRARQFQQLPEVMLPAFDGNDTDAAALHQDNLLACNAVLVYYGAAPKAWVDIKLRERLNATGYGRPKPIALPAVYIAPPDDRRKERQEPGRHISRPPPNDRTHLPRRQVQVELGLG